MYNFTVTCMDMQGNMTWLKQISLCVCVDRVSHRMQYTCLMIFIVCLTCNVHGTATQVTLTRVITIIMVGTVCVITVAIIQLDFSEVLH